MKTLTDIQALTICRDMWTIIAKEGCWKEGAIGRLNISNILRHDLRTRSNCILCVQARSDCNRCLLYSFWNSYLDQPTDFCPCDKPRSPYYKWSRCNITSERKYLALKIVRACTCRLSKLGVATLKKSTQRYKHHV